MGLFLDDLLCGALCQLCGDTSLGADLTNGEAFASCLMYCFAVIIVSFTTCVSDVGEGAVLVALFQFYEVFPV